jgi:hypothetical protein
MSQNIFIDVDGTLLNSNEGVDPRAPEILRQIRLKLNAEYPDSGLYLWSGAGGDYARSKAEEHGLAGFFSGFAGKPDVIIDDNPSSVFPKKTIAWSSDSQWQNLMPTVFPEFSPSPKLIELLREVKATVQKTNADFSNLYRTNFPTYPIPFFGNLEMAEVLTISVNPSSEEFCADRNWQQDLNEAKISHRLVNYFRLWNPPPHGWFTPLETRLRLQRCSYWFNTAHIDLSPRATLSMQTFKNNPATFHKMICEDAIRFLPKILKFAKNVKEVRFPKGWRYGIIPNGNKAWPDLKVYVEKELPEVWLCLQEYQISLL